MHVPGALPRGPVIRPERVGTDPSAALERRPEADPVLDFDTLRPRPIVSPGDPTGAIGPDFILSAVNVNLAVYDRDTQAAVVGPMRLRDMSSQLDGLWETDPKVYYDPYDDVFVLTFLAYDRNSNFIEIVVIPAATADDMGTWCRTHMNGDQVGGNLRQFADYPSIGFTRDRVTLSTNNFDFATLSNFEYSQVISMKKSQLYDDPTCTETVFIEVLSGSQTRDPDGSQAFTIQPATSIGGSPTAQFMLSLDAEAAHTDLVLWRLKVLDGDPRLVKKAIAVRTVDIPPWGYQCGGSAFGSNTWWDTGDTRLINAWYDADRRKLYAATAVKGNIGGGGIESVIRWYEVWPKGRLSASRLSRTGRVGSDGFDSAWPSVATSADGTLFINYSRASLSECLSIFAATVPRGTTAFTRSLIFEGEARYEFGSGPERWGDYSAINRDPLDGDAMALFNAYSMSDGSGSSPLFRARVTLVTDA